MKNKNPGPRLDERKKGSSNNSKNIQDRTVTRCKNLHIGRNILALDTRE